MVEAKVSLMFAGRNREDRDVGAREPLRKIEFDSVSEYACAVLLEKYLSWEAIPSKTFHIPIGRCQFDFRVGNTLIEYHPISLRREFLTGALGDILSAARFLKKPKRVELLESVTRECRAQYIKRRGQVAAAHPEFQHCQLICTFSPEEFIQKGIQALLNKETKSTKELCTEFRQIVREATRKPRR